MSVLGALVRRFGDTPVRIYECRRCSTTLDADDDACPHCESTSIVCYEL